MKKHDMFLNFTSRMMPELVLLVKKGNAERLKNIITKHGRNCTLGYDHPQKVHRNLLSISMLQKSSF